MPSIKVGSKEYSYIDINQIAKEQGVDISRMPFSIKILLENVARNSTKSDVSKVLAWVKNKGKEPAEIQYLPYRVLMQDFTGVPAIVDLAAMRDAAKHLGGDIKKINPVAPVHLVIDHSVQVDSYGSSSSNKENTDLEIQRNKERYEFLKWGQKSFNNLYVVPPGTGICHQINLEYIASVVAEKDGVLFFDTVVGTDSHTTMVNGLGVLGWGVGGIEAESVMLGQSVSLLVPEVIGFKLEGQLHEGITATDLILTITQMLRKKGVVGKFVEFYGEGLKNLSSEDRATIANMAPEYGATCGIFPIDQKTLDYLLLTGRSLEQIEKVKEYAKVQGAFGSKTEAEYTDTLVLDISSVKPCVAGPKRPQDRLTLDVVAKNFEELSVSANNGIILNNENFYCRPFKMEDADLLHEVHEDKKVIELFGEISLERTKEWLEVVVKHQEKYGYSQWAVFDSKTHAFMGKAGILNIANDGREAPSGNENYTGQIEVSCFLLEEFATSQQKVFLEIANWAFENLSKEKVKAFVRKAEIQKIEDCLAIGFKKVEDFDKIIELSLKNQCKEQKLQDGSIVIAAITSCTNTSNPSVLIAAGLLAKKAVEMGLKVPSFVKTSLAPGSRVAEEYLQKSGLQTYLDKLGFNVVGFGCTTCIGNSGPLKPEFEKKIIEKNLTVAAVLSGNRNFEGRIHALVKANYLASPPLVVAYALLGNIKSDILLKPLGKGTEGREVFLKDIWPTNAEIHEVLKQFVTRSVFEEKYKNIYEGTKEWQEIKVTHSDTYHWKHGSTYIENPPYFEGMQKESAGKIDDILDAKPLLILGDSITTDHISPAGDISKKSPAAQFLRENGVEEKDFNSYGARRGSNSVMTRGTFANIRIKNEMLEGIEGGYTKDFTTGEILSVYDMATRNKNNNIPAVVIAGKEYGTGSSRDWAAKGTFLLGVKAVIAESFERIHRSNLIGMGVIPFEFINETRKTLNLKGNEKISIKGLQNLTPMQKVQATIEFENGTNKEITLVARIDTNPELKYIKNGGIMQYVIRNTVFNEGKPCNQKNNNCQKQSCYRPITKCLHKTVAFIKKLFACNKEQCCNNKTSCQK
jgi:aconitase A